MMEAKTQALPMVVLHGSTPSLPEGVAWKWIFVRVQHNFFDALGLTAGMLLRYCSSAYILQEGYGAAALVN